MKVLVTGAGGFLGRHVVAALREAGHAVRALHRSHAAAIPAGVEAVRADLSDAPASELEAAFDGVDVLVHLAAEMRGDLETQLRGTVGGTGRLLDAMAKSSARRVVLASSFSVYDVRKADGKINEQTPLAGPDDAGLDAYARAKLGQEQVARDAAGRHGWSLAVLRPGLIWGKGRLDLHKLGRRVGPVQFLVAPSSPLPLTHVESCAAAFARAAEASGSFTLNVVDGHDVTAARYAKLTGAGKVRVPVPYGVGKAAAKLAFLLAGRRTPGFLQPRRYEAYYKPLRADNAALRRELGWSPKHTFDEALRRSRDEQ